MTICTVEWDQWIMGMKNNLKQTCKLPVRTHKRQVRVKWVIDWLVNTVKLGEYKFIFIENDIDGLVLNEMTLESLIDEMGIDSLDHRQIILEQIALLNLS